MSRACVSESICLVLFVTVVVAPLVSWATMTMISTRTVIATNISTTVNARERQFRFRISDFGFRISDLENASTAVAAMFNGNRYAKRLDERAGLDLFRNPKSEI